MLTKVRYEDQRRVHHQIEQGTELHHAAFDANLIGINPDFRIHVAAVLLEQNDGPMLEQIKAVAGHNIRLPRRAIDRPDRDRLAERAEQFRAAD